MRVFFSIPGDTLSMPGRPKGHRDERKKGMERMGALIWFVFVAVVTVVLERESFFP